MLLAKIDPSLVSDRPDAADAPPAADADLDAGLSTKVWEPERSDTYRTVCVRLCDGSYTPMSFATTKARLKVDAAKCQASCGSPSRMFYAKAGASELESMRDLDGEGYVDLPNAYKFRTSYDAACTCRSHPWEQASVLRHRQFAAAALQERVAQSIQASSVRSSLARDGANIDHSMSRRAELPSRAPLVVTGSVQRSLPAEVAASADLPLQREIKRPESAQPSLVQAVAKEAPGLEVAAKVANKQAGAAKGAKGRTAQAKSKHREPVPGGGVYVTSRDLRPNVKGSFRAQREFDSQDFWRMSFWEPR